MSEFRSRLLKAIPGGCHTYSRGYDQFPANAPDVLVSGSGAYVESIDGNRLLDYGMGLRSVNIGYAEPQINAAATRQISLGNNLTRASSIELEAAELLIDLIGSVDMVKFAKNGSTAVSAAVKLSRAYTGRTLVARCSNQPFLSYDDWFIGSTVVQRGIPLDVLNHTKLFEYDDLLSLESLLEEFHNQFACVVIEAATISHPNSGFLPGVQRLCEKHGVVFVLDEMITGFRWHLKGAQHYYKIQPDISTFGKAMANGFSVACVAGRREIMELGSIEVAGRERVFLLSTTHGAEMSGLGAFVSTVQYLRENPVIDHLWDYGKRLVDLINAKAREFNIEHSLFASGIPCSPTYATLDLNGRPSLGLRTLFMQEMIKGGVLMPWIAICYRHGEEEYKRTGEALDRALSVYQRGLHEGVDTYLDGPSVKPVFRRYN